MRTLKIAGAVLVAIALGMMPSSCSKKDGNGNMTVLMTDAPAAYLAVNVEVTGMQVHHETSGWINLQIKPGVYNLLELQNDVTVVLANKVELPAGKITQMRMILGASNSIVDATGTYELKIASGAETGLKMNLNAEIIPGKNVEVLIDFDANASVVATGHGSFQLKPVIKVESIIQH